jgi:hypothetical protein
MTATHDDVAAITHLPVHLEMGLWSEDVWHILEIELNISKEEAKKDVELATCLNICLDTLHDIVKACTSNDDM